MRLKCSYDLIKPNIIIRSLKRSSAHAPNKRTVSICFVVSRKKKNKQVFFEWQERCTHPVRIGITSYSIVVPFLVHPHSGESHPINRVSKWRNQYLALFRPHEIRQISVKTRCSPRVEVFHDICTQRLPHPILPPIEIHIHESLSL